MTCYDTICDIIKNVTGKNAEQLIDEGGKLALDPLDLEEIIMEIEEQYDIIVADEANYKTVRELSEKIESQMA